MEMSDIQSVKQEQEHINRRSFFKKAWAWLGALAFVEFTVVGFNILIPGRKNQNNPSSTFIKTVGYVDEIAPGSILPNKSGQFYLIRYNDGGFLALSLICTHLGCSINWEGSKEEFICPCHASAFNKFGDVLNAPATRALDVYRVFIEEGLVKVDTSRKIRRTGVKKPALVYA